MQLGRPLLGDVVDRQRHVRRRLRGKKFGHTRGACKALLEVAGSPVKTGRRLYLSSRIKDHQARLVQIDWSHSALVAHEVCDDDILLRQTRDLLLRLRQETIGCFGRALILVSEELIFDESATRVMRVLGNKMNRMRYPCAR